MKHTITYLLLCSLLLLACNTSNKEVKTGLPTVIFKIDEAYTKLDTTGNEGLAIRFYSNGTYSHFAYNFYAYGKWKWNENTRIVTLTPETSKDTNIEQHYKIEVDADSIYTIRKMIMIDKYIFKNQSPYRLIVAKNADNDADPFSKSMNTWRIKPKQSESKIAIRIRTLNYLKFLQCYYEYLQDNQLRAYSKMWYATPIQLHYGNGVRMSYNTELTDWYSCFYNEAEANEAYMLIGGAMKKATIDFNNKFIYSRNLAYIKQLIKAIA